MTHSDDSAGEVAPVKAPKETQDVHLQLTFTLAPKSVKVSHLGKPVWSESAPTTDIEHDLKLPYPDEGIDLRFEIEWPPDAPFAGMRVKLTDPAGAEHEKGMWSKGPADDVLTFP